MVPEYERTPQLRASDADREAAADRLRIACGEGRLGADELDDRLTEVYGARLCSELSRMTSDVTPPAATVVHPIFIAPTARKVNLYAIASFLMGLFWMGWFGSLAAIPLGHVALRQIRRSGGTQAGRTLAVVGLVLGYVGLLSLLAFSGMMSRGLGWN